MKDEWWLSAAISDDKLVADLLLRLKDSSSSTTTTTTSQCSTHLYMMTSLPPTWGLRHPRSSLDKKRDASRGSPTTPLSYACLTPPSDGGGCDYSSGNLDVPSHPSDRFRSKISTSSGTLSTVTKRCKRKKTFAELKEEVSSLIKEQTYLKKELATMHVSVKEQRSMNASLKRMKIDLHQESGIKPEANSPEPEEQTTSQSGGASSEAGSTSLLRQIKHEDNSEPDSSPAKRGVATTQLQSGFVLPDLNMIPDEDCGEDDIVGIMS